MRALRVLRLGIGPGIGICLGLAVACARADSEPKPAAAERPRGQATAGGPLVLELFTSQGCSSCPPADELLARLARAGSVGDRALAPLSFHVDYWNDLGWADPYSSPAWTERQRQYARAIGDGRVYTPELVVGGAAGMVGSNLAAVTDAIQRAARPALLPATARWTADTVTVTAPATAPVPDDAEIWVAIWEDGTSTHVPRGENAGETLVSERVVRHLERAAAAGQNASLAIRLDPAWHASGAVVFAQRTDRRIVASALLRRDTPPARQSGP